VVVKYFAYGSNMSISRLRQRVPSAQPLGTFSLLEHDLRFHKWGRDNSGKCDAHFTGNSSDVVLGVLYEIEASEKVVLDEAEDLGFGYDEKVVAVIASDGRVERSVTYCAIRKKAFLLPYSWYKDHVMVGALQAALPEEYIKRIEAIEVVNDPDKARDLKQRAIHVRPY